MYTYLENINSVAKRHGFPYNLIAKIKDIRLVRGGTDYYRFTIYNRKAPEQTCICKPSIIERLKLSDGEAIVIEYAPISNFMDLGDCLLIRNIQRPVFCLTGDKSADVKRLAKLTKQLIETQFQDGSFDQLHHRQMNEAYVKFVQAYSKCHKEVKW